MFYMIQPSEFTDHITGDGTELTKMPYPFYVNEDGTVQRQDFWRGDPARVVGFQKDSAVQQVDLRWAEAKTDPAAVVGMYLVTADSKGNLASHDNAVSKFVVIDDTPKDGTE